MKRISLVILIILMLCGQYAGATPPATSAGAAFLSAIKNGSDEEAIRLLNAGSKRAISNVSDSDHRSVLHWAASRGDVKMCELLLRSGARVGSRDDEGNTPLIVAASCGGDYNIIMKNEGIPRPSLSGFPDTVRLLLEHGANPNAVNSDHLTALYSILPLKVPEAVSIADGLIRHGAKVRPADRRSETILHQAVAYERENYFMTGNPDLVRLILGKRPDTQDINNSFLAAIRNGDNNMDVIRMLWSHGAKVNWHGNHGQTPLLAATASDNQDAVFFLIDKGANVNDEDDEGNTPLLLACMVLDTKVARALLRQGADVNHAVQRHGERFTPLSIVKYAATTGLVNTDEMMAVLKQAGARE